MKTLNNQVGRCDLICQKIRDFTKEYENYKERIISRSVWIAS